MLDQFFGKKIGNAMGTPVINSKGQTTYPNADWAGADSLGKWSSILKGVLGSAAILTAAGATGALNNVTPGGDVEGLKRGSTNPNGSGITINMNMNGDYATGTEAGTAAAQNINKSLADLVMGLT
jgi:hypothetical protein